MENPNKYELTYPSSLSNRIRLIVTSKGDQFEDEQENLWVVGQVVQPPMGALPELLLLPQETQTQCTTTYTE